jgi:hypothetical protein
LPRRAFPREDHQGEAAARRGAFGGIAATPAGRIIEWALPGDRPEAAAGTGGVLDNERTGGAILVDNLIAQGATLAYCVPGESYLPVLDALHDVGDRLRLIVCRQEGGVAYMAEAHGKLTGRPASPSSRADPAPPTRPSASTRRRRIRRR